MSFSAVDHGFMARALQLARRGLYSTTPNPRVGCVMVRDGSVIGEGWHEQAGLPHAEAVALNAIVGAGSLCVPGNPLRGQATAKSIKDWANAQLGKTQRLAAVEVVDALPRSAIGKILKRELRDSFAPAEPL